MKIIFITALILCVVYSTYTQDMNLEIRKLKIANDSLQKEVIKPLNDSIFGLKNEVLTLYRQKNTCEESKGELIKKYEILQNNNTDLNLSKVKNERDSLQIKVVSQNTKLTELNQIISDKDNQILELKKSCDENARIQKEKGKQEIISVVIKNYKDVEFDHLVKSSTIQSVAQDMELVGSNNEVMGISKDLQNYFIAEELLSNKLDTIQIKNSQAQLKQTSRQSESLSNLKILLENYKIFNDGLKETIKNIVALDNREMVTGMGESVQKHKKNKILAELSSFIFDYDFNFTDYPYLSAIVLEINKRKQPNADADISDLLSKL